MITPSFYCKRHVIPETAEGEQRPRLEAHERRSGREEEQEEEDGRLARRRQVQRFVRQSRLPGGQKR